MTTRYSETVPAATIAGRTVLRGLVTELAESALLGMLEPAPLRFTAQHESEVSRVRGAIRRALDGKIARLRDPVNRNAFLLSCLDYTANEPREHLLVGYGFRYGSTTKIDSVDHAVGETGSVQLPSRMAHTMWQHYGQRVDSELLVFHNHPYNPLNLLLDNGPLASRNDRLFLQRHAISAPQFARLILGQGRVLFYLGENGFVKQFSLPSLLALASQQNATHSP
jgi:hypothetical protein